MVVVTKSDFVWIEPHRPPSTPSSTPSSSTSHSVLSTLPIGARVLDCDGGRLKILDDQGHEEWLERDRKVKLMHPTSVQGREDMIQLGDLHEAAILRNIAIRYREKLIYTYTGSILIAVNPYTNIPIYTADEIRMYRRRRIGELPPHIFAIADNAYTTMRVQGGNQSIVISGESGAGKTESTKLVLQFIATVSGQHSWIEQQILEANPILEAFGNAKTLKNDNSSRFGKYVDVHFAKSGAIEGARIDHYLLEKSRIVSHAQGERNYHIFYCLLAGLAEQEKSSLYLTAAENYYYLNQGSSKISKKDAADLSEIRSAMKVLLFKEEEIMSVFRLLAAILHIGNIKFRKSGEENSDVLSIYDKSEVAKVARLLEVNESTLISAITTKTLSTHGDIVISALSPQAALDARDALAKGIYGRIFEHVVTRINDTIYKPRANTADFSRIGILDIFGFEVFQNNSFEQLCINYANEALQQFFVHHVFKLEQKEYDDEKINWSNISFSDNQMTLDLIAARPMNILSLIDEESIFPKGTDSTLLSKLHTTHSGSGDRGSPRYLRPKSDLLKAFGIMHYAGNVFYNVRGFLDKNRDTFSSDLSALIASSKSRFLVNIFDRFDIGTIGTGTMTVSRRKGTTVGSQFRKSLDQLMATLSATEPFFIRCIKPNDDKMPLSLERDLVIRQLRNTGMLDAIRIRRVGYPIRHAYEDFLYRYRVLVPGLRPVQPKELQKAARLICERVLGTKSDFALGKTKVFLKDAHDLLLEQEYFRRLNDSATIVQKTVRGWLKRKAFLRQRNAAVTIQKTWKGYDQRRRYRKMVAGFTRLQAVLRSRQLVYHFNMLRSLMVAFQARSKGSLVRHRLKTLREARERERTTGAAAIIPLVMHEEDKENRAVNDRVNDGDIVGELFDFLPHSSKSSPSKASSSFILFPGEDLGVYDFGKFAATYFQGAADALHTKKIATSPLLANASAGSKIAALSVWLNVLRFMGDVPDIRDENENEVDLTPVMTRLFVSLQSESKKTTIEDYRNEDDFQPVSSLDKLHYIVGQGILRPELRDEIYCQLCKQLNGNSSKTSEARGWILMSLCIGCFAPSEKLIKYLVNFIRTRCPGSPYAYYMEERLSKTLKNGTRKQPPSYLELQANKSTKPIVLAITLMDSTVRTVHADSSSTASEVCRSIAERVGLEDRFGFSLYIALHDKVSSLGAGSDHVMDAISQCEQSAKEQNLNEKAAPWRLFFRKEIFAPWHDTKKDPVSTSLIYEQVVRGIRYGEYRCDKEEDLALLCAQQYKIHEPAMDIDRLQAILPKFLPEFEVGNSSQSVESWMQRVMHAYRKQFASSSHYDKPSTSTQAIKEDVVTFAKNKWPLLFSRFYEAIRLEGPSLPHNDVIIAVNWTGLYVVDNSEEILAEFSFSEIANVQTSEPADPPTAPTTLTLVTIAGDEYLFEITNADDVKRLVHDFLQGLKKRSRYLVGIKAQKEDESGRIEFERGDLLVLSKGENGEKLLREPEVSGENTRTGLQGKIRSENVYVLPTLTRPTASAMEMFPRDWIDLSQQKTERGSLNGGTLEMSSAPYTLEKFASENFKSPTTAWKRTLTLRRKEVRAAESWKYSREPLTAPLLKKLHDRAEPSHEAVVSYTCIMKYMGDLPSRRTRIGTEFTDAIFGPALKYEVLRDELYCQLMKQLTYNPSMISEERGWELLWLASGLIAPTQVLFKEISQFLRSRRDPLSIDTLHRIVRMMKVGSRKYPPHQVEIDAIQNKTTHIFHKVFFPDQSEEAIEVFSGTRARDFSQKIATRLGLKSVDGFALFIKFGEKVLSVPDGEFFFDFVRNLADFAVNGQTIKGVVASPGLSYQVIFMRKLWLNAAPGEDRVADLIFHFHQELPKYLQGYHKCSKEEVSKLAAYLLRARTREDKAAPLAQIGEMLSDLVPRDSVKGSSKGDWRKNITREYEHVSAMSPDDAKLAFLEYIGRWPTFGSSFFLVKQSSDPVLPDKLLVAINKDGVHLYNADTKNPVVQYPFTSIANWTSGNTYFHITVGNLGTKASRLLFETSMAYKMDDLLASYLSVLIGAQTRNPKKAIENQHI